MKFNYKKLYFKLFLLVFSMFILITRFAVATDQTGFPEYLSFTVFPIMPGDENIAGLGDPGNTIVIKFPNGTTVEQKVSEDGSWAAPIPSNAAIIPDSVFTISERGEDEIEIGKTYVGASPSVSIDPTNSFAIYGKGIAVSINEFPLLKDSDVLTKTHARAWSLSNNEDLTSQIIIDKSNLQPIEGPSFIYLIVNNFTHMVPVLIYDPLTTVIDEEKDVYIYARDFPVSIDEIPSLTDDDIIEKSGITGSNISYMTNQKPSILIDRSSIKNEIGIYEVTLNLNGLIKTISAHTIDDSKDTLDIGKDVGISAKSFIINYNNLPLLTDNYILKKSQAKAWKISDKSDLSSQIKIDKPSDEQFGIGSYPIKLSINGVTRIVSIDVIFPEIGNVDEESGIMLTGNCFTVNIADVDKLTDQDIILNSNAKALKIDDRTDFTSQIVAYKTRIKPEVGTYIIKLMVNKAVHYIAVDVIDPLTTKIDIQKNLAITAKGFILDKDDVKTLTGISIIDKSSARAWNVNNIMDLSNQLYVDTNVKPEPGSYLTSLSVSGITQNIIISVIDGKDTSIDNEKDSAIFGKDFSINVKDLNSLTNENILSLSSAKSWKLSDGTDLTSQLNADKSLIKAELGSYAVTLSVNDVSKAISVTVKNDDTILVGDMAISAHDFSLTTKNIPNLSRDMVKTSSGLKAWNTKTGADLSNNILIDLSLIKPKPGYYKVSFQFPSYKAIQGKDNANNDIAFVTANVYDEGLPNTGED